MRAALSSVPAYLSGWDFRFWAELFGASLVLYLLLVALGRLLKYRLGTRLGRVYQLFCVAAAPFLASTFLQPSRRHVAIIDLIVGPYLRITSNEPSLPGYRDLGALTAVLGSGVLVRLLDQYFWRGYLENRRKTTVPKFIREVAAVLIVLSVLLLVLEFIYDKPLPGVLAASGVVSIILGFALQDSLGNIIAGFSIQIGRPFQVGDWLLVDNQHVQAVEINWRSTRFITNDDVQLDVPNQQIVRGTIVNYHGGGSRHAMRFEIGIQYDAPPNRVRETLITATLAAQGVLKDRPPSVFLKNFGDSSITYEVRYWIDDHRKLNVITDAVRTNIWYALRRQQISMPFPIRTVQLERSRLNHHVGDVPKDGIFDLLRQQALFKSMGADHLKTLVSRCPKQHYGAGEVIIREGANGASMFVLIGGEAGVAVTAHGEATRVATLRGGDCFGEMSLLTGEKRSASVNAVIDCEVMEITKPVFADIIQRDPDLLPRLSELLAHRQMQTDEIVQAQKHQPALLAAKEQEYQAGFLSKLKSFFEL